MSKSSLGEILKEERINVFLRGYLSFEGFGYDPFVNTTDTTNGKHGTVGRNDGEGEVFPKWWVPKFGRLFKQLVHEEDRTAGCCQLD